MTAKTPEQRIADLGLALPPPARAVANYAPWVITGNLVMTSGNLPWRDGKLAYVGKIGREISGDDGYKSCQLSCLNALAQIKQAVGELARVNRIVRLEGVLGVDDAFKEHPKCLDGASDLINTAFEEKGRHTRAGYHQPGDAARLHVAGGSVRELNDRGRAPSPHLRAADDHEAEKRGDRAEADLD